MALERNAIEHKLPTVELVTLSASFLSSLATGLLGWLGFCSEIGHRGAGVVVHNFKPGAVEAELF